MGKLEALVKHRVLAFFLKSTIYSIHEIASSPARVDELRKSSEVRFGLWKTGCGLLGNIVRALLPSTRIQLYFPFSWYFMTLEVKVRWL